MSSITDYTDRTTCPLFGDAAGAVLLEPTTEEYGIMDYIFHTDGSGSKISFILRQADQSSLHLTKQLMQRNIISTRRDRVFSNLLL
jgi:3-oxoacyl-[acyl-carrier-protein] synthase III